MFKIQCRQNYHYVNDEIFCLSYLLNPYLVETTVFYQFVIFFLSALLKNILSSKRENELVEEIIDGLVTRLMKRMCTIPENAGTSDSGDTYLIYSLSTLDVLSIFFQNSTHKVMI